MGKKNLKILSYLKSIIIDLIKIFKLYFITKKWENYINYNLTNVKSIKSNISVLFIVRHASQWKYQGIYELLKRDSRFTVKILIAADANSKSWKHDHSLALKAFKDYRCEVISAFDTCGNLVVYAKDLNADVVFFRKLLKVMIHFQSLDFQIVYVAMYPIQPTETTIPPYNIIEFSIICYGDIMSLLICI